VGLDGLPNFDQLGAEGHHYDVESGPYRFAMSLFSPTLNTLFRFPEFFLHHEGMIDSTRTVSRIPLTPMTEQFHSTPETQTDESYNHPEDIEHFAHHEAIEREEARREAKYQGITVEEALAQHNPDAEPKKPKVTRVTPPEKQDPEVKYGDAKEETKAEWGAGDEGFKIPKTPAERLRKNVPYKVKCPLSYSTPAAYQSLIKRIPECSISSGGPGETSDTITPLVLSGSYPSHCLFI